MAKSKRLRKRPPPRARPTGGRPRALVTAETPRAQGFPIVGIGASAGGLEALEEFFAPLPADSGMAFVVVSHQRPGRPSLLPELIGKHAVFPVHEIADGVRVQPNHIYLPPPGRYVELRDGALRLVDPATDHGASLPIDYFFRSLAEAAGPLGVGIVLSGSGSDGTLGLKAIKAATGLAVAQDPGSARYPAMPQSAIAAVGVDYATAPSEMPGVLSTYWRRAGRRDTVPEASPAWRRLVDILRERSGIDFAVYKPGTIRRRVERRIHLSSHIGSVREYAVYLERNPTEVDALCHELLIGVTSFFRDRPAFDALAARLAVLLDGRSRASRFRVWVAGCSTGEEAYSVAIALQEAMEKRHLKLEMQIFATDADAHAIEIARAGAYPAGIAQDVPAARLERFFVKDDSGYSVRKEVRDGLIFAHHNLLGDAPFSKLDLVVCRNLLIYLEAPTQARLLGLFHYALNPGGVLFLGSSESADADGELFRPLDRKWKLFRRTDVPARLDLPAYRAMRPLAREGRVAEAVRAPAPPVSALLERVLLERYAPVSVVVNAGGEVVYIHGHAGQYLEPAPGEPTRDLMEMARAGLRPALTAALRKATTSNEDVVRAGVRVRANGETVKTDVAVRAIREPAALRGLYMVTFEPSGARRPAAGPSRERRPRERASEVMEELRYTKERLQLSLEELQATNEELTSSNEELTSTNEELQSANEEQETTREEMQSLNEELQTVNAELQAKLADLADAHTDLQNLLNSTEIATIFLDTELCIRRFTPRAPRVVSLIESDVGRPLADLSSRLDSDAIVRAGREVLQTLVTQEREVQLPDGTWYQIRILPYRTMKNEVAGLVLTFVDITRVKQAEHVLQGARAYMQGLAESLPTPLAALDGAFRVTFANHAFHSAFGLLPGEVEGREVFALAGGALDQPALRETLTRVLPERRSVEALPLDVTVPTAGPKRMVLNVHRLGGQLGLADLILLGTDERPRG